jgi:hypothetical protein
MEKIFVLLLLDDLIGVEEEVVHSSPPFVPFRMLSPPVYPRKPKLSSEKEWIRRTKKGPPGGRSFSTLGVGHLQQML